MILSGPRGPARGKSYFRGFQPGVKVISRSNFLDPVDSGQATRLFREFQLSGVPAGEGVIFGVPAGEEGYSRVPARESRVQPGK